jgi:C4-type Zn-finger protein
MGKNIIDCPKCKGIQTIEIEMTPIGVQHMETSGGYSLRIDKCTECGYQKSAVEFVTEMNYAINGK